MEFSSKFIELDADEQGPMAMKMITDLCGMDAQKWSDVEEVSKLALEERIGLWDAFEEKIMMNFELA